MFKLYFALKIKYFLFKSFKSSHLRNLFAFLESLGLDRKHSFYSLALWWKYGKLGDYMAWQVFFELSYVTKVPGIKKD